MRDVRFSEEFVKENGQRHWRKKWDHCTKTGRGPHHYPNLTPVEVRNLLHAQPKKIDKELISKRLRNPNLVSVSSDMRPPLAADSVT